MIWSYSRLHSFGDCPYKWFLRYIKHFKESPRFYSSYGSFVHKLIEMYYRGEITARELPIKFMFDFKKEVQGERPSEVIVEKCIQNGLKYFDEFKPFPYEMVGVEMKVEFDIDGIPMIGYIDYLGKDGDDFVIIDNKSRDLKPRSKRKEPTVNDKLIDSMLRQLYLYSTGVYNKYGKFPTKLCFNCFKAGTFIEEPFRIEAYNEAIEWAKSHYEDILNTEDFPPNIDYFTCKFLCGVSEECVYWDNGKFLWKGKK